MAKQRMERILKNSAWQGVQHLVVRDNFVGVGLALKSAGNVSESFCNNHRTLNLFLEAFRVAFFVGFSAEIQRFWGQSSF